ncbi:MAG: M48 family metalloprotease [Candidatus Chromulinivorax sp.]|nr:M48 family metalloprotease [Candidatus Chromulinivorax sp.]
MNIKNLKVLCGAMLAINLMQSPIEATITNENDIYYPHVMTGAGMAVTLYIGYNYLIRQEFLVKNKFPVAQAWYDALTQKYPAAHLDQKQFVQTPKLSLLPDQLARLIQSCGWTSSHDHIYFKDTALTEITTLYQKIIDGYPLHEREQLALARHEFTLLHEAGHIEHNDAKDLLITIGGLLFLTHGLVDTSKDIKPKDFNLVDFKIQGLPVQCFTIPAVIQTIPSATFITGLLAMLRYQESRADKFACDIADDVTLKGAITIFEDEEIDNLYELESKTITPFIITDSTAGKIFQNIIGPVEFIVSALVQQGGLAVKSTKETRWMYDFIKDPVHQGASVRAQLIKNELARREHHQ